VDKDRLCLGGHCKTCDEVKAMARNQFRGKKGDKKKTEKEKAFNETKEWRILMGPPVDNNDNNGYWVGGATNGREFQLKATFNLKRQQEVIYQVNKQDIKRCRGSY